jgi:hypothetical protein
MLVALQLVVDAAVPLKVTVPLDPKFAPVIVTPAPTFPDVGFRLVIEGPDPDVVTVKRTPLLAIPFTVTTTFPVVAPDGTDVAMLVAPQLVAVAVFALNVTVLGPCAGPKFIPVIVTGLPTDPEAADRFEITGNKP